MPQITIITPTLNREHFLPSIAACVLAQHGVDWEWRVLDDSATPSVFMQNLAAQDARVHYTHATHSMTIGAKRNALIHAAQGDLVAHFDDDDYYGPNYLANMSHLLHDNGADMVKLSGFYMHAPATGFFGYMDLNVRVGHHYELIGNQVQHITFHDQMKIGTDFIVFYGFSYVYKRSLGLSAGFDDINICDDESFAKRVLNTGHKLIAVNDSGRDCLHLIHPQSTARCFSQHSIPSFLLGSLFPGFGGGVVGLNNSKLSSCSYD